MEEYERQNIERYFDTFSKSLDTLLSLISGRNFTEQQIQLLSKRMTSEISSYFNDCLLKPIKGLGNSETNLGQIETQNNSGNIAQKIPQADLMKIVSSIQEIFYCFKEIPALLADPEKARAILERHPQIVETISSLITKIEIARKARQG